MPEIQTTTLETIKASALQEITSISDSNYIVVTDGVTSKKAKATLFKSVSVDLSNYYTKTEVDKKISDIVLESGDLVFRDVEDGEIFELTTPTIIYGSIVLSTTSLYVNEDSSISFTVALDKAPTNNQVVKINVNNAYCTLDKTSLTFTASNYNVAQTVTVIGVHDNSSYVNKTTTITVSSPNVPSKTINVTSKNIDTQPGGDDTNGYVTDNLDLMYDLTKYEDGYTGDVLDEINNVKANITGQESYTSGRNGFLGKKFMINSHKTVGMNSSFTIPTRTSFTTYPFSIELYCCVRSNYNPYSIDGELNFLKEPDVSTITNTLISTRDGDGTGNGLWVRMSALSQLQLNGSLSTPLINFDCDLCLAYTGREDLVWKHIVCCFDSKLQKVYVDGELVNDTTASSISITSSTRQLILFNQSIVADMKLIRVYNSILTDNQAKQNYDDVISKMEV